MHVAQSEVNRCSTVHNRAAERAFKITGVAWMQTPHVQESPLCIGAAPWLTIATLYTT